ncbi:MAG: response regulator [Magnetococcales bacterium]|nr:response regulator [Magnetococcales bacterium]
MKTLIADDEFANRELLKYILQPYCSCVMAEDGLEAVALFKQHLADGEPFDLVLLDIMMPNMDGHQAVQAMRKKEASLGLVSRNEVKVIMVTALDSPKEAMKSYYNDGCTDYVTKPVTQQKIDHLMDGVVAR